MVWSSQRFPVGRPGPLAWETAQERTDVRRDACVGLPQQRLPEPRQDATMLYA